MVLNVIFGFLLNYPASVAIIIYSIIVIFLINIFYKFLINQEEAKQLKEKTRELNKQMREEQKAGNKERSNQLLREVMQANSKLMRLTIKPMIISFIIVIILLPFLADSYGDASVKLENNAGIAKIAGIEHRVEKVGDELKIGDATCKPVCKTTIGNKLFEISMNGNDVHFARVVALLPLSLPFVGDTLGWLGWYIVVSIPIVIIMRKLMKIYV